MQQLDVTKILLVVNSSTLTNVFGQSMTQSVADADDYVIKRGLNPTLRLAFDFGLEQGYTPEQLDGSAVGGPICTTVGYYGMALVPALTQMIAAWGIEGVIFSTYTSTAVKYSGGYIGALCSVLSKYPFIASLFPTWTTIVQRVPQNWLPWVESDGVPYPTTYNPTGRIPSGRLGCPVTMWSSDQIAEYPMVGTLVATTTGVLKSMQGTVTPGSGYPSANGSKLVHLTGGSGSGAQIFAYTPSTYDSWLATLLPNSSTLPQTAVIGDVTKWGRSGLFTVGTEQIAYDSLTYLSNTNPDDVWAGVVNITQRGYGGTTVAEHNGGKATLNNPTLGVCQVINVESGYGYQVGDVLLDGDGDLGVTGSGFSYTITSVGSSYQIWYSVDPASLGIAVGQRVRGLYIPELTFVQSIGGTPGNYYVYISNAHKLNSLATLSATITYYNESMTDPALNAYKNAVDTALIVEQEDQRSKCHVLSQAVTYVPNWNTYLAAPVSLTDTTIVVDSLNPPTTSGSIWVGSELMRYTNYNAVTHIVNVVRTSPMVHAMYEPVMWVNTDNQNGLNFAKDNGFSNIYEVCYYDAAYPYAPYYIKNGGGSPNLAPPAIDPAIPPIFCMPIVSSWNWGQGGQQGNGDSHYYFTESMRGRVLPGAWGCAWTSFEHIFGQGLILNGGSSAIITFGEPGATGLRAPGQIFVVTAVYKLPLMLAHFISSNYPNGANQPNSGVIGDPLYTPYKNTPVLSLETVNVTEPALLGQTSGAAGVPQSGPWNNIPGTGGGSWTNIPGTGGGSWTNIPGIGGGSWTNIPGTGGGSWADVPTYTPNLVTQTLVLNAFLDGTDDYLTGAGINDPYYGYFGGLTPSNIFNIFYFALLATSDTTLYLNFSTAIDPGANALPTTVTRITCGTHTLNLSEVPITYTYDPVNYIASWTIPIAYWFPFVDGRTYQITFIREPVQVPWTDILN